MALGKSDHCIEHIFALSTILDTRKRLREQTFVCFIDFKKAYDKVNRTALWHKLRSTGIQGDILNMI